MNNLRAQEKEIASQYMGEMPWIIVFWGIGGTLAWLALWPLVIGGWMPLAVAAPIATFIVTFAYMPGHDALHHIVARPGSKLHWLNETVAEIALLPLSFPRRPARLTHMVHHRHTNDPKLDPDYFRKSPNFWHAVIKSVRMRHPQQDMQSIAYRNLLMEMGTSESKKALLELMFARIILFGTLSLLAWNGLAIEALLLWWLPRHVALTYIHVVLSWAPHHPFSETTRYRSTRAFKSPVGTILSAGLEYHIVHHLYPTIPVHRTPAAYRALKPLLEKQGCELNGR